jgi:hypothetical protein
MWKKFIKKMDRYNKIGGNAQGSETLELFLILLNKME